MSIQDPSEGAVAPLWAEPPLQSTAIKENESRVSWLLVLVAWLAVAIATSVVVEVVQAAYTPVFNSATRPYPTAADLVRITKARIESGTIGFGATGALLGLALGLAGGGSRRKLRAAVVAGVVGLVLGGVGESVAAWIALQVIYTQIDLQADDMLQTLLSHEGLWAVVGLTAGLALGLGLGGRGRWWKTAIGGLIGVALATVVYEFIGAVALATHGTHQPYGESLLTRVLAQTLITLGAAFGSAFGSSESKRKGKAAMP